MKTLQITIIAAVALVSVILLSAFFVTQYAASKITPYANISITGLKPFYLVTEPINFEISVDGYASCTYPLVSVIRYDGKIAWQTSNPPWSSCPADPGPYNVTSDINNLGGPFYLSDTGEYTLRVKYGSNQTEKKFEVNFPTGTVHPNFQIQRNLPYDEIGKTPFAMFLGNQTFNQITFGALDSGNGSMGLDNVTFAVKTLLLQADTKVVTVNAKYEDGLSDVFTREYSKDSPASPHPEIFLSYHKNPTAGILLYNNTLKLLVSVPNQTQVLLDVKQHKSLIKQYDLLSENACGQFYTAPTDNHHFFETYPVLILKQNSVGCAKLTFTINYKYDDDRNGAIWPQMAQIGEMSHIGKYSYTTSGNSFGVSPVDTTQMFETASIPASVDLANYPVGSQFTVLFIIKPLPNATGFYDYSIIEPPCGAYPLAVGYSSDQVNYSDFSKGMVTMHNHSCFNAPYLISSVQVSGMTYKEVQFP